MVSGRSSAAGRNFGQGCCEIAAALDRRLRWAALSYASWRALLCSPTSRVTVRLPSASGTVRAPGLSRAASLSVSPYVSAHAISRRSSAHSLRSTASGHECSSCPERTRSAHLRSSGLQYLRELASPPLARRRKSFRARCIRPLASCSLLPPRLLALVPGAPRGPRMGESGRGPAAPRSSARNGGRSTFFPCRATPRKRGDPGRRHSSRETKKCLACRPPLRCGPSAAPRVRFDRPRPVDRHRGRDGRGPTRHRRVQWRPSAASRSPRTATMPAR